MFFNNLYYGFVKATFFKKIISIILFGSCLIFISAPFIGLDEAYRSFSEFSSIPDKNELTFGKAILAITLSLSGFLIFSLVISIFLQWREQSIINVNSGHIRYGKTNHTLILNISNSVWYILEGLNKRTTEKNKKNVLILIHNGDNSKHSILFLRNGLNRYKYKNLSIDIKCSDFFKVSTYIESNAYLASSTIILSSNRFESDALKSDNFQLLTTNMLCSIREYKEMLNNSFNSDEPHRAIVQYQESQYFIPSLDNIQGLNTIKTSHFKCFNSPLFNRKLLSIAMIDPNYLQLFNKIIIDYTYKIISINHDRFPVENMSYRDVCCGFENGILIGTSTVNNGQNEIYLNPTNLQIKENMKLIFLCRDSDDILYSEQPSHKTDIVKKFESKNIVFHELKEIRLLIIGDAKPLDFIDDYLNANSKINKKNIPFDTDFDINILLHEKKFDTVILNIDDDHIYRYIVMLKSIGINLHNIIVNINNEDVFWSLQKYGKSINQTLNIVFQEMYSGYLMEQFSFQESILKIYDELLSPKGNEFYFLENTSLYSDCTLEELKFVFSSINSILVGFLMKNNEIKLTFDCVYEHSNVNKLIVISRGTI